MLRESMATVEAVTPREIRRVAAAVGLTLDDPTAEGLASFARLFLLWNAKINLGGRIGGGELVERHFLDAFAAARFVEPRVSVVDVGSGGGLPAIPLALVRADARFTLYEPTGKKVAFLRTAARELGLTGRLTVQAQRVDGVQSLSSAGFDVAMSRATLAPGAWLDLGRTLIVPSGRVLVFGTDDTSIPGSTAVDAWAYASNRRLLVFGLPTAR